MNNYSEGDVVEINKDLPSLRQKVNRNGIIRRVVDGCILQVRPFHTQETVLLYSNEVSFLYKRY